MRDPKEFLDDYDVEGVIKKIQQQRGLAAGDRAMRGAAGMDINSPERVSNYMYWQVVKRLKVKPR